MDTVLDAESHSLVSWRKIAISNNVGGVKHFSRRLLHALREERHFALVDGLRFPTLGSLLIVGVRNSVRPIHRFEPNRDHDYYFELPPAMGSGMPNHYVGDLLHTMAISGHSRVRTELFELSVIPSLAPHPVQMHCKFACHGDLRDLPSPSHREVEELTPPLRLAAYGDLRCFHQQEAKQ